MILIIDNYDSFTYNLYQIVAQNCNAIVIKNDQMTLEEIAKLRPRGIILSPGPGRPEEAGICIEVIRRFGSEIPILGVCLGHQAIGIAFGAKVARESQIFHGRDSFIFHSRKDLFQNMSLPFKAGRYHSLIVEEIPEDLIIDAETSDGKIMGMHHKDHPIYGIQFHPESILTFDGKVLIQNFLKVCHEDC